uniref:SCP domain-containing protein n=1 Tax=Strongyloides stercoralis TaxID=6248 RepID=A0AAF5D6V2_STRER
MTNTNNKEKNINVGEELINYINANTLVIEDLIKQMVYQNNETKSCLLKIKNLLENFSETKESYEKTSDEIKTLNDNVKNLLSNKNSSLPEEEKSNFMTKLDYLIKSLENNIFSKKEALSSSGDISNLVLKQILEFQQQQQERIINLQQQLQQQNSLTTNFKEAIDSYILKLFSQLNHNDQCNCLLKDKVLLALTDNLQSRKENSLSKVEKNENIIFYFRSDNIHNYN